MWIKVLLYLEYSELKHVRSVSKFLLDCCNDRRVQESLFTAPLNQDSLELNHKAGDGVELHPALSLYERRINLYEPDDRMEVFVDWLNDYDKIGKTRFEELKNLGKENLANPPIHRIKILDQEWDNDSISKKIKDWVQRPVDSETGRFLDELEGYGDSEEGKEGSDQEKDEEEVEKDSENKTKSRRN